MPSEHVNVNVRTVLLEKDDNKKIYEKSSLIKKKLAGR